MTKLRRKRKKIPFKFLLFLTMFAFSFVFTINCLKQEISNEEFLRLLLSQDNPNIETKVSRPSLWMKLISFISNIDLKKPFTMIENNYVFKNHSKNASDGEEEESSSTTSQHVQDPFPEKENKNPTVYIYNTHQLEEYATDKPSSYNVTPNVMMASYILREKLRDQNINSLVEENNVNEVLKINNWNYASSYKVTKLLMQDAKEKNPSLNYFIDLHRDSVSKKISTTTIGTQSYAKILFIVGLENPNYQQNLELTTQLNESLNTNYPGISRGIYKKEGKGVNGIYNQDFHPHTILIEVGGQENTIDEVYNTIIAIANTLVKQIGGKDEA